jgi:hypothetical protein
MVVSERNTLVYAKLIEAIQLTYPAFQSPIRHDVAILNVENIHKFYPCPCYFTSVSFKPYPQQAFAVPMCGFGDGNDIQFFLIMTRCSLVVGTEVR